MDDYEDYEEGEYNEEEERALSVREWMAGVALSGILQRTVDPRIAAVIAVQAADALIKELNKD